jgi:hypothetical protein
MQQPHVGESMEYADIGKVRTVVQAAACNQLLAEGWILLGPIPLLWFWIYEYPLGGRVSRPRVGALSFGGVSLDLAHYNPAVITTTIEITFF